MEIPLSWRNTMFVFVSPYVIVLRQSSDSQSQLHFIRYSEGKILFHRIVQDFSGETTVNSTPRYTIYFLLHPYTFLVSFFGQTPAFVLLQWFSYTLFLDGQYIRVYSNENMSLVCEHLHPARIYHCRLEELNQQHMFITVCPEGYVNSCGLALTL